MQRLALSLAALSVSGCLFVPENEATLQFRFIMLHEDQNGVIGALLCDEAKVGQIPPFLNIDVDQIVVVGRSQRGLEVRREASCEYTPDGANFDAEDELGLVSVGLPADTYADISVELQKANGDFITWNVDPDLNSAQAINILQVSGDNPITLASGKVFDLGDTFVAQGIDGAVARELKVFVQDLNQ
jgi:hypothetical protein